MIAPDALPLRSLTVRAVTTADEAAVIALLAAQLAEHDIPLAADALARAVAGLVEDPRRGALLLALVDGDPIGVACLSFVWTLEHGGRSAWLDELYVRPAERGRGVGGALLRAALARVTAEGCRALDLEVEEGHERAANLYARAGFRAHRRARFVKPLDDG